MVALVLLGIVVPTAVLAAPAAGTGAGAPLAEAGLDQQVLRGETVRLDATGSRDPDGSVVGYRWRVRTPGGRAVAPQDPAARRTAFPATAVGRYEVRLTVTDDDGNTGTDTMYVRVEAAGNAPNSSVPSAGGRSPATGNGSGGGVRVTRSAGDGSASPMAVSATDCSVGGGGFAGGCEASAGEAGPVPWARIEGPVVVKPGNDYTYTAVAGGLGAARSYEWEGGDAGREHTLRFHSSGEYDTRVDVSDASGRTATDRLEVFVSRPANERPRVEIDDPGPVAAGERVRLSASADDPDGRIRSTEWSPGRRVVVPTDGSSRTVRVTVTDDDGASVTDSITVAGEAWNRTEVGTDTMDVTCYFTDERQRDGRNPYSDRCIYENANTASLTNGPSRIESFRRNEKIDLHWRRITESELEALEGNDTSTDHGVAARSPHDEADRYGFSDDLVRRTAGDRWSDVDNDEAFTLKGRTVEDDIDGDGEVNAADWDLQYRTTGDTANVDRNADVATAFKRSVRGGTDSSSGSDPLGLTWDATASTVEGRFAGTSIDAENQRDRVAALRGDGRDSADAARDTDERDGHAASDGSDPAHDAGDGGIDGAVASDDGGADGPDDADGGDGTDHGDDRDHGDGGDGRGDADPGSRGPSEHDPHGGRVVVLP